MICDVRYAEAMRIAELRRARGLTQVALAEMAGVEQPTISRIENGDDGVSLRVLKACASALGVTVAELFLDRRTAAEQELLRLYRQLSPERQQGWQDMARSVVEPEKSPIGKSA